MAKIWKLLLYIRLDTFWPMKNNLSSLMMEYVLGLGEYPDIFITRVRVYPGISEKIPGYNRVSEIHYIRNINHYFWVGKCIDLTFFGHILYFCGHIHQKTLIKTSQKNFEKNPNFVAQNSKILERQIFFRKTLKNE